MHPPSPRPLVRRALLAAALALLVTIAVLPALAPPAAAQGGCYPAGGVPIPEPTVPSGDFAITGGGWGHGAGMSQYGAQGAARLGCSAADILATYYPGTQLVTRPSPPTVVVGLSSNATSVDVTAQGEPVNWHLCHYTSGACTPVAPTQQVGATWTVAVNPDATYTVTQGGQVVWQGGDLEHNLRANLSPDESANRRVQVSATGDTYRWGVLQFDSVLSTPSYMFLTVEVPGMERYLRGIAEVPASWPSAALQAQVVAARSYALRRITALGIRDHCRCHLVATPADQNYEGWSHEAAAGQAWRSAVDATAGQVLVHNGAIAETFYSSSHGGWSESSRFVFGGELPYIQPVDDRRWDLASDNPYRRWAVAFTAAEMGAAAKVGVATSVELLEPRGAGGRVGDPDRGYGGVRVTGTEGTVVLSGNTLRQRLGLRSTLFNVFSDVGPPPPSPPPSPPPPSPPPPSPPPPPADGVERIAAETRITTAVAVSRAGWERSDDVVIAAAENFPDALAGVALASQLGAPLLLSNRAALPSEVAAEVQRLGADDAWLLGGTAALATEVRAALADMGLVTYRVAGDSRYETAAEIARTAVGAGTDVALLALGQDWPDAVSAGSLAALPAGAPILLTTGDEVPTATVGALRDLGVERVQLVGGTAVISQAVEDQLTALGIAVERLAGPTRYATSVAVAGAALAQRSGEVPVILASGAAFPDALPAGALASRLGGVLVLVPADDLDHAPHTEAFLVDRRDDLDRAIIVGGVNAVADRVAAQVGAALGG